MGKKNFLKNSVIELLESIAQNLSSYLEIKDTESLHQLRVDLKKLSAIFFFAEKIYKEKYHAAILKPLFHEAGFVRESQINLRLLSTISFIPEKLISSLKKKENILSQEFFENGSQYVKLLNYFSENVNFPELRPDKIKILKYFKKEQNKAEKILQNINRENLHSYRKQIKKIIYIFNILPKRIQNKVEIDIAFLNKQQHWIGEWHNTYAVINFLSNGNFSLKKSDYITNLKENEKRQFNILLKNLTNFGQ